MCFAPLFPPGKIGPASGATFKGLFSNLRKASLESETSPDHYRFVCRIPHELDLDPEPTPRLDCRLIMSGALPAASASLTLDSLIYATALCATQLDSRQCEIDSCAHACVH
jgi:hypothetical protein